MLLSSTRTTSLEWEWGLDRGPGLISDSYGSGQELAPIDHHTVLPTMTAIGSCFSLWQKSAWFLHPEMGFMCLPERILLISILEACILCVIPTF